MVIFDIFKVPLLILSYYNDSDWHHGSDDEKQPDVKEESDEEKSDKDENIVKTYSRDSG